MDRKLLGIIGAALLFVGAFMPIVSMPIVGSVNYFQNGKGDGVVLIGLAVISLVLVLIGKFKWLWGTSIISLGLLAYTFIRLQNALGNADAGGRLGRAMADAIQIQWGWAVLVLGVVLLMIAASKRASDPVTTMPSNV